MIRLAFVFLAAILIPQLSFAGDVDNVPHAGKCGPLLTMNMGDGLNDCKVGDVILVQVKVVPMYCDFRYQIVAAGGSGVAQQYYCVMRIQRNK